jgi:hypothetical protein
LEDTDRDAGVADLNRTLADGSLEGYIAVRFKLDGMVVAHKMVEAARHSGDVVFDIA